MITLQDLIDYHRKAAREAKYGAQYGQYNGSGHLDARVSYQFHLDAAALLEKQMNPQQKSDNEVARLREELDTAQRWRTFYKEAATEWEDDFVKATNEVARLRELLARAIEIADLSLNDANYASYSKECELIDRLTDLKAELDRLAAAPRRDPKAQSNC